MLIFLSPSSLSLSLLLPGAQIALDSVIEREWGRQSRPERPSRQSSSLVKDRCPPHHDPRRISSIPRKQDASKSPPPALAATESRTTNGEFWWRLALEKHTGEVGAISQTIPWEALCRHSLATYFVEVLGDEGRDRPLLVSDGRRFVCCTAHGAAVSEADADTFRARAILAAPCDACARVGICLSPSPSPLLATTRFVASLHVAMNGGS